MASRVPLEATPVLEWPGVQLTAVAVTMEDGHTIAFLGDSQGQLHRVSPQEVLGLRQGLKIQVQVQGAVSPGTGMCDL